ncbi:MAG: pantoate--beta-alanine ligase [Planctomycetota bacterium]
MQVLQTIEQVREALRPARRAGRRIGFVPTMGAMHDGHWSLVDRARQTSDEVVVSIFVNPLQFGPSEDLEAYPRSLENDLAGCERRGCDWVFLPTLREMYPHEVLTRVVVRRLNEPLCGRTRTGHFEGVATVVCKLFNIVLPDVAFFGEKDFQQLVIVRRMVRDLNLSVEIVACPTVRAPDGLALSSRNAYLNPDQRSRAVSLSAALRAAAEAVKHGERDARRLIASVGQGIAHAGPVEIEYVEVVDPETLEAVERVDRPARLCVAARFGPARLIDNIALDGGACAP